MIQTTPRAVISRGPSRGASQGEVLTVWALWMFLLLVIAVTYSRLDSGRLYHVTGDGIAGGLSRVLVELNYPISLVAIALVLIALDTLPARWWLAGGSAIALCAVTAWPGVVDEADLDARLINAVPAVGVGIALALTLLATARAGVAFAPGKRFDRVRVAIGVVVLALSLPWIAGNLGWFLPDGIVITERPITGSDGSVSPAVHLGNHHGFDGALLAVSALILSRQRLRSARLGAVTSLYISLMFAYGAVNFGQDLWNEQIVKRDWVDWAIPSAVEPTVTPIWLVILVLTGATMLILRTEDPTAPSKRTTGAERNTGSNGR